MGTLRVRTMMAAGVLVLLIGSLSACGGDDETDAGGTGGDTSTPADGGSVDVTLQEFAIATVPSAAAEGAVAFNVSNIGPDDIHEFVVVSTDLPATDLPTEENGSVSEDAAGMEVVDEVEDLAVDANETLTVDLDAGNYVLICNIYDADEHESHYQEGMRTSFIVE
ncbi:MAG: hypothetical protein WEA10_07860 [Actinomycetota bacterium]